jgi:hypothetical protein
MVNSNLDASRPVLFAIRSSSGGHAIVCDGYGYNSNTQYHHLNLGWGGIADAWYNLPIVDTGGITFDTVDACIYNICKTGSGEIISGRVTDAVGTPISGAIVTAERVGGGSYTDTTDSRGIYALDRIPSQSQYNVSVAKAGYVFADQTVLTGTSSDHRTRSGNEAG